MTLIWDACITVGLVVVCLTRDSEEGKSVEVGISEDGSLGLEIVRFEDTVITDGGQVLDEHVVLELIIEWLGGEGQEEEGEEEAEEVSSPAWRPAGKRSEGMSCEGVKVIDELVVSEVSQLLIKLMFVIPNRSCSVLITGVTTVWWISAIGDECDEI